MAPQFSVSLNLAFNLTFNFLFQIGVCLCVFLPSLVIIAQVYQILKTERGRFHRFFLILRFSQILHLLTGLLE